MADASGESEACAGVQRFPIEAGHIMMFGRAIADPNAAYATASSTARSAPAAVAPPTFVVASAQYDNDYELRPRLDEPWFGSGRDATGVPNRSAGNTLHAEQHFQYHRPVRSGDVLRTRVRHGEGWEKDGRSGRLRFAERVTEYLNQDDELVVTATSVTVTPVTT